MQRDIEIRADPIAGEWAIRSEFWIAENAKFQRKRRVRERNANSLILTGHGASLRIERGALVIRHGFTHCPQKQECHRLFKGDLALPRMIILLDGSGSLSFDAPNWLGEQGVALARITGDGGLAVMASGAGFTGSHERLRWQFDLQRDGSKRIEFARDLISRKLKNSASTLQAQFPDGRLRKLAIEKVKTGIARLTGEHFAEMDGIRAIEGESAAAYFAAWTEIEMRWTAQCRYPVPDHWRFYRSRSSILTGRKAKNWKASHPINAMLNYAYAVRAAQLQVETVAEGLDPYAGIMHNSREGFPAYVYDVIEPERPKVDAAIIAFARGRAFSGADFILRRDGVCRLSPQLARVVATVASQGRVKA
ncbi:MAG: CRISPR-associated endonuclease Cas1 [Hyphomicrobiales bacterium]|nr:CRISPR-associated endonuclease Cas1 [Hyphomicrobiales bacterium]